MTSRKRRPVLDKGPHGIVSTYNRGCGCGECTAANTEYNARRRERNRQKLVWDDTLNREVYKATDITHGTASAYRIYGCRCALCEKRRIADNEANRVKKWT